MNTWADKSPEEIKSDIERLLDLVGAEMRPSPAVIQLAADHFSAQTTRAAESLSLYEARALERMMILPAPTGRMADTIILDDPFAPAGDPFPWPGEGRILDQVRLRERRSTTKADRDAVESWFLNDRTRTPPHPGHMTRQRRRWIARKGER